MHGVDGPVHVSFPQAMVDGPQHPAFIAAIHNLTGITHCRDLNGGDPNCVAFVPSVGPCTSLEHVTEPLVDQSRGQLSPFIIGYVVPHTCRDYTTQLVDIGQFDCLETSLEPRRLRHRGERRVPVSEQFCKRISGQRPKRSYYGRGIDQHARDIATFGCGRLCTPVISRHLHCPRPANCRQELARADACPSYVRVQGVPAEWKGMGQSPCLSQLLAAVRRECSDGCYKNKLQPGHMGRLPKGQCLVQGGAKDNLSVTG